MMPPHPRDVLDSAARADPDEVVVVTKIAGQVVIFASAHPETALDMIAKAANTILIPMIDLDYSEALH